MQKFEEFSITRHFFISFPAQLVAVLDSTLSPVTAVISETPSAVPGQGEGGTITGGSPVTEIGGVAQGGVTEEASQPIQGTQTSLSGLENHHGDGSHDSSGSSSVSSSSDAHSASEEI